MGMMAMGKKPMAKKKAMYSAPSGSMGPMGGGMMAMGGPVGTGGMKNPNKAVTCNAVNQ